MSRSLERSSSFAVSAGDVASAAAGVAGAASGVGGAAGSETGADGSRGAAGGVALDFSAAGGGCATLVSANEDNSRTTARRQMERDKRFI